VNEEGGRVGLRIGHRNMVVQWAAASPGQEWGRLLSRWTLSKGSRAEFALSS
jgi:hypothetical protein